jgi:hypothetical protein
MEAEVEHTTETIAPASNVKMLMKRHKRKKREIIATLILATARTKMRVTMMTIMAVMMVIMIVTITRRIIVMIMAKIMKKEQKTERKAQMRETNNALPSFVTSPTT